MTSIEWLVETITSKHDKSFIEFYKAEIEQAKEMERQQIDASVEGTYTSEEVYSLLKFLDKDKQDLYKWFGQFKRKQL